MKFGKWAVTLIGLGLFLFILSRVDIARVIEILSGINIPIYALSIALLFFLIVLKAVKWKLVLKSLGEKINLWDSLRFYFIGLFISNITPGKVGDFAKAWFIKRDTRLPAGIASVFIDRFMDVGLLLVFCVVSLIWFIYYYKVTVVPPEAVALAILVFLAILLVFLKEKYLKAVLRPLFRFLVPERHKGKVSAMFSDFFSAVKSVKNRPGIFAASLFIGLIIWFLSATMFYAIAQSLSIPQPPQVMFMIFPLMALADLLPISFSGLGTRDAILIFMLSFFSVPTESAVALSILFFFTGYLLVSLVGLLLFSANSVKIEFGE